MSEKPEKPKENSEDFSNTRRSFLKKIGAAGLLVSLPSLASAEQRETKTSKVSDDLTQPQVAAIATAVPIVLKVNGQARQATIDPRDSLLDTLRDTFHLTGTENGADTGQ